MSAAHAAALRVCDSHFSLAQHSPSTAVNTLCGLETAIAHGPLAVGLDPALHTLFGQLWSKAASLVGSSSSKAGRLSLRSIAACLMRRSHQLLVAVPAVNTTTLARCRAGRTC